MNEVLIINLSPRKNGTSAMLAQRCESFLKKRNTDTQIINLYPNLKDLNPLFSAISEVKTIMMIGPCYIDTYPADTTFLLEEMKKNRNILHGQALYGIIQGGMPYVHTHESGLKMLEIFAQENDLNYKGGFVIGLGAMLNGQSLDKLPNGKKVEKQFELFLNQVANEAIAPALYYQQAQIKMPGFVYGIMAKAMNKKIDQERRKMGVSDNEKNPYDLSSLKQGGE